MDNVNIEDFNADGSIDLWWKAKSHHCNQHPRKEYQKRKAVSDEASPDSDSDSEPSDILEDWYSCMNNLTIQCYQEKLIHISLILSHFVDMIDIFFFF